MRRPIAVLAAFAFGGLVLARARAAEPLDWEAESARGLELLRDLIRQDTQSRNETKLLEGIKARLEKIGLEPRIFEKEPGRGNLVARLKGTGKGAPLLLMAHVDTVKFDKAEGWSADPLGAEIKNGELIGRGSLDDKGQVALAIMSVELLVKEAVPLERDVILMLEADEENSGTLGAKFLVGEKWDELAPIGGALNEAGRCTMDESGKVFLVGIQTAEKIYNDVILRVKGRSGHSSVPRPGNAILKLARAIERLEAWKPELRVTPPAVGTFRGYAATEMDRSLARAMADLESTEERTRRRAAEVLAEADPRFNALLRSTFAFTLLKGGVKANQLPPSAEVNLNIRLLPDESLDEFLVGIRHALADPEIEIEVALAGEPSPPSKVDHPLYRAIEATAKRHFPDAAIVPLMSTGATDSRFLRNKGVPAYGIGGFPLRGVHQETIHANDERLPVASFGRGLRFYYDVVKTYVTTGD